MIRHLSLVDDTEDVLGGDDGYIIALVILNGYRVGERSASHNLVAGGEEVSASSLVQEASVLGKNVVGAGGDLVDRDGPAVEYAYTIVVAVNGGQLGGEVSGELSGRDGVTEDISISGSGLGDSVDSPVGDLSLVGVFSGRTGNVRTRDENGRRENTLVVAADGEHDGELAKGSVAVGSIAGVDLASRNLGTSTSGELYQRVKSGSGDERDLAKSVSIITILGVGRGNVGDLGVDVGVSLDEIDKSVGAVGGITCGGGDVEINVLVKERANSVQ